MNTLWCETGKHEWQRPAQRGRPPRVCPEHKNIAVPGKMSGLEKARLAKQKKKAQDEKAWADSVNAVINNPIMTVNANRLSVDQRPNTRSKLIYIQDQLTRNRSNRTPSDIAELEKMRAKIMENPYDQTGHLL
jgi:hypothetical protein